MALIILGLALLVAALAVAVAADRKPYQATANAVTLVTIWVAVGCMALGGT